MRDVGPKIAQCFQVGVQLVILAILSFIVIKLNNTVAEKSLTVIMIS